MSSMIFAISYFYVNNTYDSFDSEMDKFVEEYYSIKKKTLKKVKAKDLRKFFSTAREKKSAATDSGEGRTKGESITSEKNFQSKKKNAIEKTKIFFLFKIKSAVWKFSANRSRLKFHKHRKQFFNFVSCIISCFKNKGAFWNCFFYNSRI